MPFCNEYGDKHAQLLPVQINGTVHWHVPLRQIKPKLLLHNTTGFKVEHEAPFVPTLIINRSFINLFKLIFETLHIPQMPFNDEYGVRHSQQLFIGFQVQGATHWQWPETQIKCCLELSQGKVLEQTAPFQPT